MKINLPAAKEINEDTRYDAALLAYLIASKTDDTVIHNYSQIAKQLNRNITTISLRYKHLQEIGLITPDHQLNLPNCVEVEYFPELSSYGYKIQVYLAQWPQRVTIASLKTFAGLSNNTNNSTVSMKKAFTQLTELLAKPNEENLKGQYKMPKDKAITSDRYYCDILYGWILLNSTVLPDGQRIMYKKDISFPNLSQVCGLSLSVVREKFKHLLELRLLEQRLDYYVISDLPQDSSFLIAPPVLRALVDSSCVNAINTYIYLLKVQYAAMMPSFKISIPAAKDYIGYSKINKNSNGRITNVLKTLEDLKLIEYHPVSSKEKVCYNITKINKSL